MSYSIDELTAFYTAAKEAYLEALGGASINLGGRGMTSQKLEELKSNMDSWKFQLDAATNGGNPSGIGISRVVSVHD